jgi:hypothetical protein
METKARYVTKILLSYETASSEKVVQIELNNFSSTTKPNTNLILLKARDWARMKGLCDNESLHRILAAALPFAINAVYHWRASADKPGTISARPIVLGRLESQLGFGGKLSRLAGRLSAIASTPA